MPARQALRADGNAGQARTEASGDAEPNASLSSLTKPHVSHEDAR